MSFKHCPNCGGLLRAPDVKAGHAVRCNKCGYTFAVPDKEPLGEGQRRATEREDRRRRRQQPGDGAETTRSKWIVPILVLGAALLLVSGILLGGCLR